MLANRRPICRRHHSQWSPFATSDSIDLQPATFPHGWWFAWASVRASIAGSIGSAPMCSIWWCCAWTRVWCSLEFAAKRLWWIHCDGDAVSATFDYCSHFCYCCCSVLMPWCCSYYCCSCAAVSMCGRQAPDSRWYCLLSRFSRAESNRSRTNLSLNYCDRVWRPMRWH